MLPPSGGLKQSNPNNEGDSTSNKKQTTSRSISLLDDEGKKKSQSTLMVELAGSCDLFHNAEGDGYAVMKVNDHRETWSIRSKGFRDWLRHRLYKLTKKGGNNQATQDAICTIEAKAKFDHEQRQVYRRIANTDDKIIIDLGDSDWRAIEITAEGWRVVDTHSVHFIRSKTALPLPDPQTGGMIDSLRQFLNVKDADFKLIVGWLLMALRGRGPYPVLLLQGEQGTGKSTTTRNIRSLVDPSTVPIKAPPKDEHDLAVVAYNNSVVALDNLSGISAPLSDTLCRIAVGGGIGGRKLYTGLEEESVDIMRPVILNGIDDIATRGDLLDRSLILELPSISEQKREYESNLAIEFESAKPEILGALLDAISMAIRNESKTLLDCRPRMADFARWVTSAEPVLGWKTGDFIKCYTKNINLGVESTIEASPVGVAILKLMKSLEPIRQWKGTATALKEKLEQVTGESVKNKAWPKSPRGLTNALKRIAPALRKMGIQLTKTRDTNKDRTKLILLENIGKVRSAQSVRSDLHDNKEYFTDPKRTEHGPNGLKADSRRTEPQIVRSDVKPLTDKAYRVFADQADRTDRRIPIKSDDVVADDFEVVSI